MPSRPPTHRPAGWRPPTDRRLYDARRGSSHARGYDVAWQRTRAAVLAAEPWCRSCRAAGRQVAATEVHHIVEVRDAPHRRLDPTNTAPLCHSCHEAEHARRERQRR